MCFVIGLPDNDAIFCGRACWPCNHFSYSRLALAGEEPMSVIQILSTITAWLDSLGLLGYIQAGVIIVLAIAAVLAVRRLAE